MTERVLNGKKNGMVMLCTCLLVILAGVALFVLSALLTARLDDAGRSVFPGVLGFIVSVLVFAAGCIMTGGLKVLRPQEALVLTLFGNYYGTLKGEGFYYVNPFCSALNPAAGTKLRQSGDVDGGDSKASIVLGTEGATAQVSGGAWGGKKISLKVMTLNNAR